MGWAAKGNSQWRAYQRRRREAHQRLPGQESGPWSSESTADGSKGARLQRLGQLQVSGIRKQRLTHALDRVLEERHDLGVEVWEVAAHFLDTRLLDDETLLVVLREMGGKEL